MLNRHHLTVGLALFALVGLALASGCGSDDPGPQRPPDPPTDTGKGVMEPAAVEQPFITPVYVLDQPLRLGLAVAGDDTELADRTRRVMAQRWGALVTVKPVALTAPQLRTLLAEPSDRLALRVPDVDRLVVVSRNASGLTLREWTADLATLSCTLTDSGGAAADRHRIMEGLEQLVSWSGRVTAVHGTDVTLALRGSGLLVGRNPPVRVGDVGQFDYHRPGALDTFQRVRGSFGRVKQVTSTTAGTTLVIDAAGWYRPKVGDRWRRMFLPGGRRRVRVVSSSGTPLAGFVVYAHRDKFSREHDDFAGTTDASGVVELADTDGGVRFVQVVSTVQDIDFVFFQGVVPVAHGLPAWDVQIADMSSLDAEASNIQKRLLSAEQMNQLRGKIKALLDASALLVRNARFPEAIENLENALRLLAGVQNADASGLRATVARLKDKYGENLERQKLIDSRTEVLRHLAEADQAVYAGRFSDGVALLEKAKLKWPAKLFAERAKLITKKLEQAKRLVSDSSSPVGRTRLELLRGVDKMAPETMSMAQVEQLETKIEVVTRDGIHDPDIIYSDSELLSRLKLKLDRASQSLAAETKRLRAQYEASMEVDERTRLYTKEQKLSSFREALDRLLQKLINNAPKGNQ